MKNRIVRIKNKATNETIMVTWLESLRFMEGRATFEEFKEKYRGENEDKKSKF